MKNYVISDFGSFKIFHIFKNEIDAANSFIVEEKVKVRFKVNDNDMANIFAAALNSKVIEILKP